MWTAEIDGIDSGIEADSKGELLRLLKGAGHISKYWYGEKVKFPIARWVSTKIIELYEDGVSTHDD